MEIVKKEISLIDWIKTRNKVVAVCVPFTSDSTKLANILRKRLDKGFSEVFYVTWKKNEENSYYISYDKLIEYKNRYKNCLFIGDSWENMAVYFEEIFDSKMDNHFMLMFDSKPMKKRENLEIGSYVSNLIFLWPSFAELDFEFIENKRSIILNKKQSDNYVSLFGSFNNLYMNENLQNLNVSKDDLYSNLNVYYDNVVKNLSNTSSDIAFTRAPKFKHVITDLLLENKKRHIVYMKDGKHGLDAFEYLYSQVKSKNNSIPYLLVIKKSDGSQEIKNKLISFNSTNIPTVLATDYIFKYPDIPQNIDSFKFVNGGNNEYINTILDLAKAEFYTGSYPRKFFITSYVSKVLDNLVTVDMINQKSFSKLLNNQIFRNTTCKKSTKIYIKGEDFYITS